MASRESHATVRKDPDAQKEFRKRHGIINQDIPVGNAEALIAAHNASQSRAVLTASLLPLDDEATDALDLDALAEQIGDPVLAAAVRGNAIVVVAETPEGRSYKLVLPANDRYQAPTEQPEEAAARVLADSEFRFQEEVAALRAEHEAELAKVREDMTTDFSQQITALREEIFDSVAEDAATAAEEAQAASDAADAAMSEDVDGTDAENEAAAEAEADDADAPAKPARTPRARKTEG